MSEADFLRGLAPAKVNLVLEVTGKRPDGYHEIDSILQTLELADRVTLRRSGPSGVLTTGPFAGGVPADDTNLAWRAASELASRCSRSLDGVSISLEKSIPAAGGLGGGASDAATVLRLLKRWWPEASEAAIVDSANAVGSDEAFFLAGGTARIQGRGDFVTPLTPLDRREVVLFVSGIALERKTTRMFAALDEHSFDTGSIAEAFARRPPRRFGSTDVYNAFERVAFAVFDGLADLHAELEARTGEPIRLAGAGPTLFWIGDESGAAAVASAASGRPCTAIRTATARSLWSR